MKKLFFINKKILTTLIVLVVVVGGSIGIIRRYNDTTLSLVGGTNSTGNSTSSKKAGLATNKSTTTSRRRRTTTKRTSLSSSSRFLSSSTTTNNTNNNDELQTLVQNWKDSTISIEEAKELVWNIISSESYKSQHPKYGMVFIKTFKTGSSTVTSMLHTLAAGHNLTIPIVYDVLNLHNSQKDRDIVVNLPSTLHGKNHSPYDIWSHHVTFHNILLDEVIPSSKGKYFSIVRDPATRIRSACQFFHCCPASSENEWIDFILSINNETSQDEKLNKGMCFFDQTFYFINGQLPSIEAKRVMEERLDKENLFLMVTERMIESMIVLKHIYNLHPLDVTYISKKITIHPLNDEETKEKSNKELLQAERLVRQWNIYDYEMYKLANIQLTNKLKHLHNNDIQKQQQAMDELYILNDIIYHICNETYNHITKQLNFWCEEKRIDNMPWIVQHLKQIES